MAAKGKPERYRLITLAILCLGFLAAVVIYLTAGEPAANPLADQVENSKAYQRSLELYGGKANLLAVDLGSWFAGLWQGKRLALTVALLTLVVAGLYYFIASPLPPEEKR